MTFSGFFDSPILVEHEGDGLQIDVLEENQKEVMNNSRRKISNREIGLPKENNKF